MTKELIDEMHEAERRQSLAQINFIAVKNLTRDMDEYDNNIFRKIIDVIEAFDN